MMLRILSYFLLAFSVSAAGQNANCGVWKKDVVRTVVQHIDTGQKLAGKLLSQLIIEKVQRGGIKAFYPFSSVDSVLDRKAIMELTTIPQDTVFIDSPGKGRQYVRFIHNEFPYKDALTYKVYEHWEYNPVTAVTTIRIDKVALTQETGPWAYPRPLFCLKWVDLYPILRQYSTYDTANSLDRLIWREYFRDSAMMADSNSKVTNFSERTWKKTAFRKVVLKGVEPERYDYSPDMKNLVEEDAEPFAKTLYEAMVNGSTKGYSSDGLQPEKELTKDRLKEMTKTEIDSVTRSNSVTGEEEIQVRERKFMFDGMQNYCVKEEWIYMINEGITEIRYLAVAVFKQDYNSEEWPQPEFPFFWTPYHLSKPVFDNHRSYHFTNLESVLWKSRFAENSRSIN
ncbi:MAG: hypothetical protein V4649_15565 [Bacteroidota bacterium]